MYEAAFPNPKGVDGIIGLADRLESDSGARTPVDDLVAAGVMDDIFGLCLQDSGIWKGSERAAEQQVCAAKSECALLVDGSAGQFLHHKSIMCLLFTSS
jgi:hypothetical protein